MYGGIIAGDLAVYIGMIYYYLLKTDWALERFSGAVQQVGAEQAKLNLTTKFAQESTTVGMLVFTVFLLHCGWDFVKMQKTGEGEGHYNCWNVVEEYQRCLPVILKVQEK